MMAHARACALSGAKSFSHRKIPDIELAEANMHWHFYKIPKTGIQGHVKHWPCKSMGGQKLLTWDFLFWYKFSRRWSSAFNRLCFCEANDSYLVEVGVFLMPGRRQGIGWHGWNSAVGNSPSKCRFFFDSFHALSLIIADTLSAASESERRGK